MRTQYNTRSHKVANGTMNNQKTSCITHSLSVYSVIHDITLDLTNLSITNEEKNKLSNPFIQCVLTHLPYKTRFH